MDFLVPPGAPKRVSLLSFSGPGGLVCLMAMKFTLLRLSHEKRKRKKRKGKELQLALMPWVCRWWSTTIQPSHLKHSSSSATIPSMVWIYPRCNLPSASTHCTYSFHLTFKRLVLQFHGHGADCRTNCFSSRSCNIFRLLRLNLMNTVDVIVFSNASSRCIQIPHEQFWPWEPSLAGEIQVSQPTYVHTCISITVSIVWKNFKSCQPRLEFLYVREISGLVKPDIKLKFCSSLL